jgi:ATP-dependent Lhr-like helicase
MLTTLEETGRARRGYFIEGLGGAQFAVPGAVDRLRAGRGDVAAGQPAPPAAYVIATLDPANPYGSIFPWPDTPDNAPRPRRAAGTALVIVDGRPVLHLERGLHHAVTFPAAADSKLDRAVAALTEHAQATTGNLRLEHINGGAADTSALAPAFTRGGFRATYPSMTLRAATE